MEERMPFFDFAKHLYLHKLAQVSNPSAVINLFSQKAVSKCETK